MKEYVGEDVPYFFTWAKDKKKENVSEPVEGTTMYRIYKGIKDVRLSFSCFKNLEDIDYKLMMYDEETRIEYDGNIYSSQVELALFLNVKKATLNSWLRCKNKIPKIHKEKGLKYYNK